MTEEQIQMFEDSRQSNSTKRNTKWGVKLFQGICLAHLKIISGNLTCLKLNVKKQQLTQIYLQKLMIKINNLKKINKKKNKTYNDDVDISLKIKQMYVLQI